MAKKVIFGDEARQKLKEGVDVINNAVRVTIGPRGRNIILDKGFMPPLITNDGVSIAKDIVLKDRTQNMGADVIKNAASSTNDKVGDGTSTATILTHAIFSEGLKAMRSGTNAIALKNAIMDAAKMVVDQLKKIATPIKRKEEITQIATMSSESEEIGKTIAGVIESIGSNGTITVEESQAIGTASEVVNGMKIPKGYISPYMVTDPSKMVAEYSNVPVLITDKKIVSAQSIVSLLEKVMSTGNNELLIICEGMEGDALSTFIINKMKGVFKSVVVQAPGFGNNKKDLLEDIAIMTGATVITEDAGMTFEKADASVLGFANKIVVSADNTIIVGKDERKSEIEKRVETIKVQIKKLESKHDISRAEDRIAGLSGGVAVIKVGAATETETKYLKLKIEDAVNATKAAIEEGIVPGGGSALARIAGDKDLFFGWAGETGVAYDIVKKAIVAPIKQIILNAGSEDGAYIIKQIQESKNPNCGYDAFHNEIVEDMVKVGIIDPVKVTRTALENAASAAATLLTTDGIVADDPEDKKENYNG